VQFLAAEIKHGADASVRGSGDDHIAHLQRAVLHQQGGNHTLGAVHLCFDDGSNHASLGVGLYFHAVSNQVDRFQQIFDILPEFCRDRHYNGIAVPFIRYQTGICQLALDEVRVGSVQVNLVHGNNNRHPGGAGMGNGFPRLRHDAVVGCHHQDNNIRSLGTAGAHGGKCRVTGSIQEGDGVSLVFHLVGTDMLRNATGFPPSHVGVADGIQQGGFSMIHMPKDGDHGRAGDELMRVLTGNNLPPERDFAGFLGRFLFQHLLVGLKPQLGGNNGSRIKINLLVNVGNHPVGHQHLDDLDGACTHPLGKIAHRDHAWKFDNFLPVIAHIMPPFECPLAKLFPGGKEIGAVQPAPIAIAGIGR